MTCWPCSSESALRTDASGPGSRPRTRGDGAQADQAQDLGLDVERGETLTQERVDACRRGRVRAGARRSQSGRAPQRAFARQRDALVAERDLREPPAVVLPADDVRGRHPHVGEEHLVELVRAGHLHDRSDFDAGRAHVDDEVGDAVVLLGVGVGRASRMPKRATCASVVQIFCPFTTYSSPSRTARGRERRQVAPGARVR